MAISRDVHVVNCPSRSTDRNPILFVVLCLLPVALSIACISGARAEDWFAPPVTTEIARNLIDVEIGDINNDGIPDMVGRDEEHQLAIVYLADASGIMTEVQAIPSPAEGATRHKQALLDWNGDGWLDLVVIQYGF